MDEIRWALVMAKHGAAKTDALMSAVERLRESGVRVAGFLQSTRVDSLGRPGFELVRLVNGQTAVLARPGSGVDGPSTVAFCSFEFERASFALARRWMEEDAPNADVILVAEVSKMEASGHGHFESVSYALSLTPPRVVVLCVRADQLYYVVERFGLDHEPVGVLELPASADKTEAFLQALVQAAGR